MLLEEISGNLAAEKRLAELVRFFLFEELELTHVSCWTSVEEDDISEIQDEEGALIDQLEDEIDMVLEKLSDRKAVVLGRILTRLHCQEFTINQHAPSAQIRGPSQADLSGMLAQRHFKLFKVHQRHIR